MNLSILKSTTLTFIIVPIFLLLLPFTGYALQEIKVEEQGSNQLIGDRVEILDDSTAMLSLNEVLSSDQFKPSTVLVPNLGVSNSVFWVKFKIYNNTTDDKLLLELAQPNLQGIILSQIAPGPVKTMLETGTNLPFKDRQLDHPNFVFELNIPPSQSRTYLLRFSGDTQIMLPLNLGTSSGILASLRLKDLIFGIYFGIILVMVLYNLFVYFALKDTTYIWYVISTIAMGLNQATLLGYGYQYLWPDINWLSEYSIGIILPLSGMAAISFMRNFLSTQHYVPKLDKVFIGFQIAYTVTILLCFFDIPQIQFIIIQILGLPVTIFMLYTAILVYKKGYTSAKYYFLAWSMLLLGIMAIILRDFGVLPFNNFTNYLLATGSALEVLLLSFALADRINILKKEKEENQAKALKALQENERIIQEQNVFLEQKVKERTHELEESNLELKTTQAQLVSAEKMASLGQLTAGIAHEINNPINFVVSNISPLKRDIDDILSVYTKYSNLDADGDFSGNLESIHALEEELDIDYTRNEINELLNGISEGAERTAAIVRGLKNFSRLDEADIKTADLHEGIESTFVLLKSELNDKIEIERDYDEAIPPVECNHGKINQVIMNILNNAIQAIEAKTETGGKGKISVSTKLTTPDMLSLSIKDDGVGMSAEVLDKVFDPFFTTKDVGEGSGLGMSIAFGIIDEHGGKIAIDSTVGEGSHFTITLPVLHAKK